MSFSPARIIHKCIPCRRTDALVPHLLLDVQQVAPIPQAVNGIGISKLMRGDVRQADILTAAGQRLANTGRANGLPLASNVADKQGVKAGGQGQPGAGLEPVFEVFRRGLVEYNYPVHMVLPAVNEGAAVALLDGQILNIQAGNLANAEAGIKRQRPDSQGANIQPVALTLARNGLKMVKEFVQVGRLGGAWNKFRAGWPFGQVDRVAVDAPAFVEPSKPGLKPPVVIIDRGILQIAGLAINQEFIYRCRGWRKARPGVGAELVQYTSITLDSLGGLAGLGL